MRTSSMPSNRRLGQRMSRNCAARTSVPSDIAGAYRLAPKATPKWPTNKVAPWIVADSGNDVGAGAKRRSTSRGELIYTRQRLRYRLERLALGVDAEPPRDCRSGDHHHRAEAVAQGDGAALAASHQHPEEPRRADAADRGAQPIAERD